MFCFYMPAFLEGKGLYVDTYLWPCMVSYLPSREAKLCGVPSCGVFDKLGCAVVKNVGVN
jgi:hypothetical protein